VHPLQRSLGLDRWAAHCLLTACSLRDHCLITA
jgi:hypothetical protein